MSLMFHLLVVLKKKTKLSANRLSALNDGLLKRKNLPKVKTYDVTERGGALRVGLILVESGPVQEVRRTGSLAPCAVRCCKVPHSLIV